MSLHPGSWVGRYRISRLIAQGGMAEVYRAEQELTAGIFRPAALKVIRPEYSESPDFREMFLDEARLACTLSHPNIVHTYEVGDADGRVYMAMELVPGQSLAQVSRTLREKGERFTDEALTAIGIFICAALEAVHALRLPGAGHVNLVHRDVSPHNLLLGPTGSLKLIDFGIAKAASNRNLTMPGVTKGKAGYFSPEQAMGKSLDGRSDLFSLGVTLYKLALGATPFDEHRTHQERNTALVNGRWKPLREVCPGLPEGFYDVVDRALQLKPEHRFANSAEMRSALEQLAVEAGLRVGPSTLAGYVAVQPEEPMPLGESPTPTSSSARLKRPSQPTPLPRSTPTPVFERPTSVERATVAVRHQTEELPGLDLRPLPGERLRRRLYLAAGTSVVVTAVVAGLFIGERAARRQAEPAAPPAVKVVQLPVTPSAVPERPAAEDPGVPRPEERQPVATVVVPTALPKRSPRPEPRRSAPTTTATPTAVVEPAAATGRGRLRIGGNDDGEVTVNGRTWGLSPQDNWVPAGNHKVEVTSLDGKRRLSATVQVRADQTAIILFDLEANQINVRN